MILTTNILDIIDNLDSGNREIIILQAQRSFDKLNEKLNRDAGFYEDSSRNPVSDMDRALEMIQKSKRGYKTRFTIIDGQSEIKNKTVFFQEVKVIKNRGPVFNRTKGKKNNSWNNR